MRRFLRSSVPALAVVTIPIVVAGAPVGAQTSPGVSWSVVPSPTTPPTQNNDLSGVSCTSSTFCAAVGTINESWNGSTWSIVPSPATTDGLNGVSCSGPSACMAVGNSAIESWNGSAWSSASSTDANLNGVSCSGPSACMAVGYITVGTSCPPKEPACGQVYQVTAIESWNGSVWSGVSSPNAPSQLANDLTGVSCTSPSECTAVGYADSYGSGYQTLIESWNGSAWSIVPSPNTSDIQTNYLSGVSCNSSTACTAVGDFVGDSMYDQTLIESWNGSVWSIKPSPNTSSNQNSSLSGVSCTSPSACTAVGSYSPGNPDLTLIESWNGSTWSIVPSPNSSSNAQYNLLRGVS